jgi:hypothetical protein
LAWVIGIAIYIAIWQFLQWWLEEKVVYVEVAFSLLFGILIIWGGLTGRLPMREDGHFPDPGPHE